MEFYKALKTITDLQGEKILEDERLANILSDFKAYEDAPALKFMVKTFQQEKLFSSIASSVRKEKNLEIFMANNASEIHTIYGFDYNLSLYLVQCLTYALALTIAEPSLNNSSQRKISIEKGIEASIPDITSPLTSDCHEDNLHIKFKNIPLAGRAEDFINKISRFGLIADGAYSNEYNNCILNGTFAGVNGCEVVVFGSPTSKNVWRVVVALPAHDTWLNLKSEYLEFKKNLSTNYGTPESHEFFLDPYSEWEGDELDAISVNKCTYTSCWTLPNGSVRLDIEEVDGSYHVVIIYDDESNTKIMRKEYESLACSDL